MRLNQRLLDATGIAARQAAHYALNLHRVRTSGVLRCPPREADCNSHVLNVASCIDGSVHGYPSCHSRWGLKTKRRDGWSSGQDAIGTIARPPEDRGSE